MTCYAGLDVSQRETQICIVDAPGAVRWTGKARASRKPSAGAAAHAPGLVRAVLESGALSDWLASRLVDAGLPAVCIDARAAHGALKGRSKTDRSDAEGLARLAQTGWFKAVRLKSRASLEQHALLVARERLVRIQLICSTRSAGSPSPWASSCRAPRPSRLVARLQAWLDEAAGMRPAITALLAARAKVADELDRLDRLIVRQAGDDPVCRRLATIPGVGAITAASFVSVVDDARALRPRPTRSRPISG